MAAYPSRLVPGGATGIGSLPHVDPARAARLVLRVTPELPAAPQLPNRSRHEQMIVQWLRALPEVQVDADGSFALVDTGERALNTGFDLTSHSGLLAFVATAATTGVDSVKLQCTGPLTLTFALVAAGMRVDRASQRAVELARAWGRALEALAGAQLPAAVPFLVFDEPGLVACERGHAPVSDAAATAMLADVVQATRAPVGVHACGVADVGVACAAAPDAVLVDLARLDPQRSSPSIAAHLEHGGWVGWGAIPTDQPVGETVDAHWRALDRMWGALGGRGCDPVALRRRALVHPACGLAGHGESQAERALALAVELGERVRAETATSAI